MNTVALVLAIALLVTGLAAAVIVRLLPTLRSQLVALALLVVCLPLGVVLASGLVMFGMHDDAKIISYAVFCLKKKKKNNPKYSSTADRLSIALTTALAPVARTSARRSMSPFSIHTSLR